MVSVRSRSVIICLSVYAAAVSCISLLYYRSVGHGFEGTRGTGKTILVSYVSVPRWICDGLRCARTLDVLVRRCLHHLSRYVTDGWGTRHLRVRCRPRRAMATDILDA